MKPKKLLLLIAMQVWRIGELRTKLKNGGKMKNKRLLFLLLLLFGVLFFSACKKCKVCQCWKDGVMTEQRNCAYGIPPNTHTLNAWEDYLVEVAKYDSVRCVTE